MAVCRVLERYQAWLTRPFLQTKLDGVLKVSSLSHIIKMYLTEGLEREGEAVDAVDALSPSALRLSRAMSTCCSHIDASGRARPSGLLPSTDA